MGSVGTSPVSRSKFRQLPLSVALALALLTTVRAADPPGATVSGHIVEASTGRAMGAVVVGLQPVPEDSTMFFGRGGPFIFSDVGRANVEVLTLADGSFRFENVRPGTYQVSARRPGWSPTIWDERIDAGREPTVQVKGPRPIDVAVRLWRKPQVSGRILDEQGQPMAGADISLAVLTSVGGHPAFETRQQAVSDEEGRYSSITDPGPHLLFVTPHRRGPNGPDGRRRAYVRRFFPDSGDAESASELRLRPDDVRPNLDFRLEPEPVYTVRVRTSERLDERVDLIRLGYESSDPQSLESDSSTADSETFVDVPGGRYALRSTQLPPMPSGTHGIWPLERLPSEPTRYIREDLAVTDHDLDVAATVRVGARVSGIVEFDGPSRPSPEELAHTVILAWEAEGARDYWRGLVLPDDRFSTIQLVPGRYRLNALLSGWRIESATVHGRDAVVEPFVVGDSDVADARIRLTKKPLPKVSGRVILPVGEAFRRVWVAVIPADRTQWLDGLVSTTLETGAAGRYDWSPDPGEYFVVASDRPLCLLQTPERLERFAAVAQRVVLAAGEEKTLDLPLTWVQ